MNKVLFGAEELPLPPYKKAAGVFIRKVLKILELDKWELSVLFCNNRYIKSLNARYRGKDEPTDVLSFSLGETTPGGRYLAGDIVISLDALEENARFFGVHPDEELRRLLVHGVLHLAGEDHAAGDEDPMLKKQEEIMEKLKNFGIMKEEKAPKGGAEKIQ